MTLKELFTNIANAIRSATGTTGKIKASDFATKINAIEYRGVAVQGVDSGQNSNGVYYHIPKGYYEEVGTNYSWVYRPLSDFGNAKASDVLSGKTFTSSSGKEVNGTMNISVASKFEQRSYENGFYAELDLGSPKTCYSAQAFSGDSEGSKQYVTPQYWSNNAWVNYTGGTVVTRYWRGQMVGGQHIGNFASVLVAYTN